MSFFKLVRPFVHAFPAETAHGLAISALSSGMLPSQKSVNDPRLQVDAFGLSFPNPVGMAAGFDKDAKVYSPLLKQGFGFVEVGTITPQPQEGNPKPRIFRLSDDQAVINRMGFNNGGMEIAASRLTGRDLAAGIVGVNIGKNKTTEHALDDYAALMQELYPLADYITINISSPNTPGLRDLQQKQAMLDLTREIYQQRDEMAEKYGYKSVLVKVAPDLDENGKRDVAEVAMEIGVDGLIVSNTTIARPDSLRDSQAGEQGGLSGAPLMDASTQVLADIYALTEGKVPLIGVGGIASADDAIRKIKAGATLIQVYSALVYQGFDLVESISRGILAHLEREGISHVRQLVGTS